MKNSPITPKKNRFREFSTASTQPRQENKPKNKKVKLETTPRRKSFTLPSVSLPAINVRAHTSKLVKVLSAFLCLCLTITLLTGIFFSVSTLWQYCLQSEFFNINQITIEGNSTVSSDDILKSADIKKGKNILQLDIQKSVWNILKNPWIENVSLIRNLPNSIKIQVSERIPSFCARKDKKLYFINASGQIISEVTPKNYRPLPILEIGPGGEEILSLVTNFIVEFGHTDFPFDIKQISMIRISAGRGFELYWENKKLNLSIGTENWKDNMKRLAVVINDIEKRNETFLVTGIRSADGQVWLTKKESTLPNPSPNDTEQDNRDIKNIKG